MKLPASGKVSPLISGYSPMYGLFFLWLYALPLTAISQEILLFDDFEDGVLTQDPAWSGDWADFLITKKKDNSLLRLNGSDLGGVSQLITESSAVYGTWEFFIRMDNFSPTNNNRAFIFLMADHSDLTGNVSGYALRTGENGQPKNFRIVRLTNGSQETVLLANSELDASEYRIKVTRDEGGTWNLYTSEGFDSTPLIDSDPVIDNTHTESAYYGLRVHYTSTRSNRFFFDDIQIRDSIDPVQVANVLVNNSQELEVTFTDRIDVQTLNPANFVIGDFRTPESAILISDNTIRLNFANPLADGIYYLVINQIRDDRGLTIAENTSLEFEVYNPFEISKVVPHIPGAIDVFFSGAVDDSSIDISHFNIIDTGHPESLEIRGEDESVVRLHYDQPLASGNYQLVTNSLQSKSGWDLPENSTSTFHIFDETTAADVIINEVLYRPVAGGFQRFLEVYNGTGKSFDLNQWQIGRGIGSQAILQGPIAPDGSSSSIPLSPGEYLVFTADAGAFPDEEHIMEISGFPAFSRFGDAVYLRDNQGNRIDSLHYQPEWGGNIDGHSLQRIDPGGASNDPSNWTGSDDISAGYQNKSYRKDTAPPEITFATLTDDNRILVRFNKFISNDTGSTFQLEGENLSIKDFDPFNSGTLEFEFDQEINGQKDLQFQANNLVDFQGNVNGNSTIPVSWPMQKGDVVINEIMYRPRSDRYSELPDQSDYIELYNRGNHAVSLEGFYLHDRPDRDGRVSTREPVSTTAGWMPPQSYAVVYADPEPEFKDTRISASFEVQNGEHYFRVDQNTLVLSVSGDEVYLANKEGEIIDSVLYDDNWHNPNLVDTRGISLERINPDGGSNDERNWTSSTNAKGGSPGSRNTVHTTPMAEQAEEGLILEPNPFSPDGSGLDDHLLINYNLDEPDYLMRIRIFDRHGRIVRTLADGEAAGLKGNVIWDGFRDDQTENRIGIYIILFEAYNSATGSNRTFREISVLARPL